MEHALVVGIVKSSTELFGQRKNFTQLGRARVHEFFQALSLNKLRCHEDGKPLVAAGLETGYCGVVERAGGPRLSEDLFEEFVDFVQPLRNLKLAQRDHAAQLRVPRFVHDSYAAAAQFLDQFQTVCTRSGRCARRGSFCRLGHYDAPSKTWGRWP